MWSVSYRAYIAALTLRLPDIIGGYLRIAANHTLETIFRVRKRSFVSISTLLLLLFFFFGQLCKQFYNYWNYVLNIGFKLCHNFFHFNRIRSLNICLIIKNSLGDFCFASNLMIFKTISWFDKLLIGIISVFVFGNKICLRNYYSIL